MVISAWGVSRSPQGQEVADAHVLRHSFCAPQGAVSDDVWDNILLACIQTLSVEVGDDSAAEKLIARLADDGKKVDGCLRCGKFKAAFVLASEKNRVEDVIKIRKECEQSTSKSAKAVLEKCDQFLAGQH